MVTHFPPLHTRTGAHTHTHICEIPSRWHLPRWALPLSNWKMCRSIQYKWGGRSGTHLLKMTMWDYLECTALTDLIGCWDEEGSSGSPVKRCLRWASLGLLASANENAVARWWGIDSPLNKLRKFTSSSNGKPRREGKPAPHTGNVWWEKDKIWMFH